MPAAGTGWLTKPPPEKQTNRYPRQRRILRLAGRTHCFAVHVRNSVQREATRGAFLPDKVFAHFGLALRSAQRTKPQCAKEMSIPGKMPPVVVGREERAHMNGKPQVQE